MSLVIVRTVNAGVHVGIVESIDGQRVRLSDARRIWRWGRNRNTLNEVAEEGLPDRDFSRISKPVQSIELLDAIEVIPVASRAHDDLTTSRWP